MEINNGKDSQTQNDQEKPPEEPKAWKRVHLGGTGESCSRRKEQQTRRPLDEPLMQSAVHPSGCLPQTPMETVSQNGCQ